MKNEKALYFIILLLFCSLTARAKSGRIITEIGSIPDHLTVQLASQPGMALRPNADGGYTFNPNANDFVIIIPEKDDQFIYSPRVIPANKAGADTLYIIPPTSIEYTVIVENLTGKAFTFYADRAVISEALATAKKDYQLTIMPQQRSISEILVAAVSEDYPAVVQHVRFLKGQQLGYMKIRPQDLGIVVASKPAEKKAVAPLIASPVVKPQPAEETKIDKVESTKPEPVEPIEQEKKAEAPPVEKTTISVTEEQAAAETVEVQTAVQPPRISANFFNNRFLLKHSVNGVLTVGGEYAHYSPDGASITAGFVGLHNIRILHSNFDLFVNASASSQLRGMLFEGSLVWNPAPFVALDVSYHSADSEDWRREYFVSRTSLGLNGKYMLGSDKSQFGVGARFRLDFHDFSSHVATAVESSVRYMPSFYMISIFNVKQSTAGFMLGAVNEAIYFSLDYLIRDRFGVNYTWKSRSQEEELLSPLEREQRHKIALYYNFRVKNRL